MDLLFQKYASPFLFLDEVIRTSRFSDFVITFLDLRAEEKEEKELWEFFLHKVYGKSWNKFVQENTTPKPKPEKIVNVEATINKSYVILNGFVPPS